MQKIKVLYIASEFAPGMIPFASKIITTLSCDKHFDVYAIAVNSGKKSYNEILKNFDNTHLIQIEYPQSKISKLVYKFYPFSIIKEINKVVKNQQPDIIHLLTGDFTLAPYILTHRVNNKWYYTVHDLHPHEVKSTSLFYTLLHKYIVWGYKTLRDKIDNLTTSSQSQAKELKDIYPNKHIAFTHFPSLLTTQIQEGNKQVAELIKENNYILFFGTVDEYKGVDLLIKAYNESEQLKNIKLVIAGKGLSYEDLINKNNNIIRLNRFIDDSEIKDLFKKALFVVYPYRSATMSGVLSIAYYFKKRVLLSKIPFFIENATYISNFFEAGNETKLQEQMEIMVNQDTNNSYNKDCYESIYSDKTLVSDFTNLYLLK